MIGMPEDDGLSVVDERRGDGDPDGIPDEDGARAPELDGDADLETLRDEFVNGFNTRNLEWLLTIVATDVETPDIAGDGAPVLAEELEAIWERSPAAILTRAFLDGAPCAAAWLPDEEGCWSRAALVCFEADDGLLSLVAMPDDPDALDRIEVTEPSDEELDEWSDWAEWDRGEETVPRPRSRARP